MTAASQDRVLVADDDRDIRDLVEFKLTQAGYDVEAVGDGAAAWRRSRPARPGWPSST